MTAYTLHCHECGAAVPDDGRTLVCPQCSREQVPGGTTRGVMRVSLSTLPSEWPEETLTAQRDWLSRWWPLADASRLAPLAVGSTPLLPVPRLRERLGMPRLWVKDDTRNPSGSTKDRASWLVDAKAAELGFDTIATASTGNAATALACVCAASGRQAIVFVPASAPTAKLAQMQTYGAKLLPVDGTYDEAFELCLQACEAFGWYNRNTAYNPFTIEGKKSAALEIALQMPDHTAPDVIVVPTGDGVILAGIAKGCADLVAAGLWPKRPRLLAVQPQGSAGIARPWQQEMSEPVTVQAKSIADSLNVDTPRNGLMALADLHECGGWAVTVSDANIQAAIPELARDTGVFAEPAAAIALPGLEIARLKGFIHDDDRVVLLVTGTGLKDIPAALASQPPLKPMPPNLDAVRERLG